MQGGSLRAKILAGDSAQSLNIGVIDIVYLPPGLPRR